MSNMLYTVELKIDPDLASIFDGLHLLNIQ